MSWTLQLLCLDEWGEKRLSVVAEVISLSLSLSSWWDCAMGVSLCTHCGMIGGEETGPETSPGISSCLISSPGTSLGQPSPSQAANTALPLPAPSGRSTCAEPYVPGEDPAPTPERRRKELRRNGQSPEPASPGGQVRRGKRKLAGLGSLGGRVTNKQIKPSSIGISSFSFMWI